MNSLNINVNNINKNSENGKRLRLRRPNHSNELITALNQSLNEGCFTDATLICEEQQIKVHRIVLSLFSQYFKRTFQLITNSCHYPVIAIKNIPFVDLKAIVEFIYSGEVSIPKEQLNSLLRSAENLEIEGLRSDNCTHSSTLNQNRILNNNSNAVLLNSIVNNNPIVASSVVSIPPQSLKLNIIGSPQRKRVRKLNLNNGAVKANTNTSLMPTNSTHVLNSSYNDYSKSPSSLSIVSLVPVSHNGVINFQTNNRLTKSQRQKNIVFVKESNNSSQTQRNNGVIAVANGIPDTGFVAMNSQLNKQFNQNQNELEKNKLLNSATISTINDKSVMSSANTLNKTGFEGLNKLYEMSDDDNRADRKCFLDKLIEFHSSNGTPITHCPTINKQALDLYKLYLAVKERGGYEKVTIDKLWIECTDTCNVSHSISAAFALRLHYKKHLLPFECKYDRNGIDPKLILESLEKKELNQEGNDAQNHSNPDMSKVSNDNQTQSVALNQTAILNNSQPIEEIWLEDDDEMETSTSEEVSEPSNHLIHNNLEIDQMQVKAQNCGSTPSTSYSNNLPNFLNTNSSASKPVKVFRKNSYINSHQKTFSNDTNSIKRKIRPNQILKCIKCNKEFVNHLLYKLHTKNNCMKAKTSLIRHNITL